MASVEALVGIEIEHEPIGLVDMVERHAPIVDLERADLHQPEQTRLVVDIEIVLLALAARDRDLLDRLAHALHGVALEEMLLVDAFRTAHQADRPFHDVRQHEGRDGLVIVGEVELGEADIRDNSTRSGLVSVMPSNVGSLAFLAGSVLVVAMSASSSSACSRCTSRAGLSSRRPLKLGCLSRPSRVHSV